MLFYHKENILSITRYPPTVKPLRVSAEGCTYGRRLANPLNINGKGGGLMIEWVFMILALALVLYIIREIKRK
jgi:hypothetical protein